MTSAPKIAEQTVTAAPASAALLSTELQFPANMNGRTDANASIYDIEPFFVKLSLPEGWRIVDAPAKNELYLGGWNAGETGVGSVYSMKWLYDGDKCVGAIGYSTFDDNGEIAPQDENYRMVVFNQLRGTGYGIDFDGAYTVVSSDESGSTAISKAVYSESYLDAYISPAQAFENPAVLCYSSDKKVYVALELDRSAANDALAFSIGESMELVFE